MAKAYRKSKLRKTGEAKLLEFHRKKLLETIQTYETKTGIPGKIIKLFEQEHPGHSESFKALVAVKFKRRKFRPAQVRVYRSFVNRLIKAA